MQSKGTPTMTPINKEELVARDEKVEIDTRRNFYAQNLVTRNQRAMQMSANFLKIGLPLIFAVFAVVYFVIGFSYQWKYDFILNKRNTILLK